MDVDPACARYHDEAVRDVKAKSIECDDIWSFCYAKQRTMLRVTAAPDGAVDIWTWTALDADTKLLISWIMGGGDQGNADALVLDLHDRLSGKAQVTSDIYPP